MGLVMKNTAEIKIIDITSDDETPNCIVMSPELFVKYGDKLSKAIGLPPVGDIYIKNGIVFKARLPILTALINEF